jgi:hypothetical protein
LENFSLGQSLSKCQCDDARTRRKQQFLSAVQILAPGDRFILEAAERVPEESLPVAPGAAALEMVVALQKLMPQSSASRPECDRREIYGQLSMSHALHIQSAHYWLELGQVDQALLELGALSTSACNHPLAVKARLAAVRAARKLNELTFRE